MGAARQGHGDGWLPSAEAARERRGPGVSAVALTMLGSVLVSLDVSSVNAIQPAIARSFPAAGRVAVSWTITAYAIAFAAVLVPAGRLADRSGRRRAFLVGLSVFCAGALVCAVSPDLPVLLAGRVLQGAGAAAAAPASLALLLALVPVRLRSRYTAVWGAAGAIGIALGPIIGGALADLRSWRWAFVVNVPVVAIACLAIPRSLPETDRDPGRALPDTLGAVALAIAAALAMLAISKLSAWGLIDPRTLGCALVGGLAAVWFLARCARVPDPLLRLELLRDRQLALLTLTTVLYAAAFFGLLFSFVLFLTGVWRLSIVQAGLAIIPMALVVIVLCVPVGRLPARFGFGPPLATGATLIAVGLLLNTGLQGAGAFELGWIPVAALIGAGIALCYLLLAAAAVAGCPAGELAALTAINQCARQLGAALGVACAATAIGSHPGSSARPFHIAWALCAAFALGAALTASRITTREPIPAGVTADAKMTS
ncbi:MAG: MFS transporter [Solirubrobacteraceae bacterium]